MSSLVLGLLVAVLCVNQTAAFAWDDFNIERLFRNSDEIFAGLKIGSEEETCVQNFKDFVDQAKRKEKWALKIMDSWAKEPSGLQSGAKMDFGHFDQCISASASFPNQQCAFQVETLTNVSYKMAVCVPDSCSKTTLLKILEPLFKNAELETSEIFFCSNGKSPSWGALQWSALLVCLAILLLCVGATVHELRGGQGLLLAFSISKNANKLFEQRDSFGSTQCLNGLKVISMAWIVLLHSQQTIEFNYDLQDPEYMKVFHTTFLRSLLYGGEYAVDIFFVIAAFLLTFNFLRDREKKKSFNIVKYVLHRYLRIMPIFAIILLLFMAVGPFYEDTPAEDNFTLQSLEECRRHWWSSLLLIQTYANPREICIYSSWYISTDFHLYLLSPLLLFPLAKFGRKFLAALCLVILASLVYIVVGTYLNSWHFNNSFDWDYWVRFYNPAEVRVIPWVGGMILGYLLFTTQHKELQISRTMNLTLWLATFLILAASFIIPWAEMQDSTSEHVLVYSLFVPIQRLLYSLAFMWTIFACVKGYGGPLNWLLSLPFFQLLTKLSYAIYMGHVPLLIFIASTQRSLLYFNEFLTIHYFLGIFTLTLIMIIPIVLMVEMPVANFEVGVYKLLDERRRKVEENSEK